MRIYQWGDDVGVEAEDGRVLATFHASSGDPWSLARRFVAAMREVAR